jgi:hypothetical protein
VCTKANLLAETSERRLGESEGLSGCGVCALRHFRALNIGSEAQTETSSYSLQLIDRHEICRQHTSLEAGIKKIISFVHGL